MWDIAAPLPLMVIAELLGFEEEHYDDLLAWSDDMIRATTLDPPPEVADAGLRAHARLPGAPARGHRRPAGRSPRRPHQHPRAAEVDGERLDDESIVHETLLLLIGGDETTRHVITGGAPGPRSSTPTSGPALAEDLDRLPVAVEEMLRWVSPIKNMARTVTRDLELRGQTAARGRPGHALLPVGQPGRGRVRPARSSFDLTPAPQPPPGLRLRPPLLPRRLAGPPRAPGHVPGAARPGCPTCELATDEPLPYRPSNFICGLEAMPVRFTPGGAP